METGREAPLASEEETDHQTTAEKRKEKVEENGQREREEEDGPGAVEKYNGFIAGGVVEDEELPELQPGDLVTPRHVLRLRRYANEYLCSPTDNTYNVRFSRFRIRDVKSGTVFLDIKRHSPTEIKDETEVDPGRFIRYRFSPVFLTLREIGATLEFTVGSRAVERFRLIERHYFRNIPLKTFDFEIGFCMPNSNNTYEHIYCLPDLESQIVEEMIANPFETRSDSFCFANDRLIMHHKAEYSFGEAQEECHEMIST